MSKDYYVLANTKYEDRPTLYLLFSELEKAVSLDTQNNCKLSRELSAKEMIKLQESYVNILENEDFNICFYELINLCLKNREIKDCEAYNVDSIEILEENEDSYVLYDNNSELSQDKLSDYEYDYSYNFWTGNNYKRLFIEDPNNSVKIPVDSNWINLDSWNGSNRCFEENHCHGRLLKHNGKWYIRTYDDYQGTLEEIEKIKDIDIWLEDNEHLLDNDKIKEIQKLI